MTMPHLMNCQHSCEGWCIPCVKEMHEEAERLQQWKAKAIDVIAQWESIWEALGQPGQIGSSKAAEAKKEVERLRARVAELEGLKPLIDECITTEWDAGNGCDGAVSRAAKLSQQIDGIMSGNAVTE